VRCPSAIEIETPLILLHQPFPLRDHRQRLFCVTSTLSTAFDTLQMSFNYYQVLQKARQY
jgi:hypothetical protein